MALFSFLVFVAFYLSILLQRKAEEATAHFDADRGDHPGRQDDGEQERRAELDR